MLLQWGLHFLVHSAIGNWSIELDSCRPVLKGDIGDLATMHCVGYTANVRERRVLVTREGSSHRKAWVGHIAVDNHIVGGDECGADRGG
jgi:hypothetical protein